MPTWGTGSGARSGKRPAAARRPGEFDLAKAEEGHWGGRLFQMPLTHGREYSEDEIWDNFAHFIGEVAPVAEEAGVRIGIHPDDPPQPELGGIPRCIFSSFDGYYRAMEIADSPNVGLCFCIGCWLEGGSLMGKGVEDALRHFGEQGKVLQGPLPERGPAPAPFRGNLHRQRLLRYVPGAARVLEETGFYGVMIPDHIPEMAGDGRIGYAYSIAYMKAHADRARAECAAA